jgi:PAS domain S-box-containing protein
MPGGHFGVALKRRPTRTSGSDEQFRVLAENAPVMIWRSGADRRCNYFNHRWLQFTGHSMDQEIGLGWTRGLRGDDYQRCVETFNASHASRIPFTMDYHLRRYDGAFCWILTNGVPYYREGAFAGFLGSCVDISDYEERTPESAAGFGQRAARLRELNHRLKNSLQTSICFSAFGRELADPGTQDELSSITERLSLLSLAHEQLTCLGSEREAGFCSYLRALAQAVHAAVGNGNVELQVSCEPVELSPSRASAVGTVVDELLTTALTERFPAERPGRVQVGSRPLADARIEVSVADDGDGQPDEEARSRISFQRQLMERLIAHANGTIRYELDGGTRCVITLDPER